MESTEPELFRKALDGSDEYNEDLRQRLISSPVFEHAQTLQREFLDTRLKKEHFISAWNAALDSIVQLEEEAEAQGVLYENVSLKGEGILVPKFEIDFAAGIAMTSLLDKDIQQARSFEAYLQPDEHHGKFAGFTLRFVEADEEGVYIPLLAYRVAMNKGHSSHAEITLFATGDLGTTSLHFDNDEQFEGALAPLDELFRICGEKAASINRINMTLASVKQYDASSMRHVAYHAEKIVNSVDEQKQSAVEYALADLITHYIGRSSSYLMRTKKFALSPIDVDTTTTYYESENNTHPFHDVCLDVVFFDQVIIKDGQVHTRDRRSIHIALPVGDRIGYVPIVELEQFEKQ
ncbi:MAG TPA: hypothetical protein VIM31_02290 [Candidatus Microsaccharimonas sp.]|jgi:hypothetical protein